MSKGCVTAGVRAADNIKVAANREGSHLRMISPFAVVPECHPSTPTCNFNLQPQPATSTINFNLQPSTFNPTATNDQLCTDKRATVH